jgi:hypothetical protein
MGILSDPKDKQIRQLHAEIGTLRNTLSIAERDRDMYRDQLEGRKDLMWWAMVKVRSQSKALDVLTRRTTTLRFAIKVMEHVLGRALTKDEWKAARDAVANEAHRERIDAEPVSA